MDSFLRFWQWGLASLLFLCFGCQSSEMMLAASQQTVDETKSNSDLKTVKIGGIDWYVDYDQALAYAKKKNLPIWLHFGENPG